MEDKSSEDALRATLIKDKYLRDHGSNYWNTMYRPSDGKESARVTEINPGEDGVMGEVRLLARLYDTKEIIQSIEDMFADRVSWKRKGRGEAQMVLALPSSMPQTVTVTPVKKHRILSKIPIVGRIWR